MATSVGQIGLDLTVNQKQFNKQMTGIQSLAKKAGAALAAAFAVRKLVEFGKQCVELGSDLEEVQNVVDVTFPSMTAKVDEFAKGAAASFGLSETMAKKFNGTFGAMAKAFGFSEGQAYEMSTALTGLAGDVASFYNITQDEAYTKLKSVFTGETESLKDLGVVMTQTALDSYAMANGFGKTTSAMSEAEKVALRYAFVQAQLSTAQGDFSRTSDSWANQVRILKLQFESLKASIGQGLINVLKPVLIWLNAIISRLVTAAKAFADFTGMFSKSKPDTSWISKTDTDLQSASTSASGLGSSSASASKNLEKAAKNASKLKRFLAGFDQINKVEEQEDSTSSGSSAGSMGSAGTGTGVSSAVSSAVKESADSVKKYVFPALATIKKGFTDAFNADTSKLKSNVKEIIRLNREVWQSKEVKTAMSNFKTQAQRTLGYVAGSAGNVAISYSTGVSGGILKARESLVEFNKTKISSIFDNLKEFLKTTEKFAGAISKIAKAFESEAFQKVVEIVHKIADVVILTALDAITGVLSDLWKFFAKPFIDNAGKIKKVFENIFELFSVLLAPVEKVFDLIASKSKKYKDSALHSFFEHAADFASVDFGKFLDLINAGLETLIKLFKGEIKLSDIWEKILKSKFVKTITKPFKNFAKTIKSVFKGIPDFFKKLFKKAKEKILEPFKKIGSWFQDRYDDICGVFSGIKDFFSDKFTAIFENLKELVPDLSEVGQVISDKIGEIKAKISAWFSDKKEELKEKWDALTEGVKEKKAEISAKISQKWNDLKDKWQSIVGNVKEKIADMKARVASKWNDLKAKWKGVVDNVKSKVADMKARVASKWNDLKEKWHKLADNVKGKTADMKARVASKWNDLKAKWQSLMDNFKDKTVKLSLKFSAAVKDLKEWVNTNIIDRVNSKFSTVPILKKIKIPHLAQGGYVKANTPQLAMIGDNRHQGEVVAPEDKLYEMARQAASMSGGNMDAEIVNLLKQILVIISNMNLTAYVDANALKKLIVKLINDHTRATGMCEIEI